MRAKTTSSYCDACDFCANVEVANVKEGDTCPKCGKDIVKKAKAVEAGNVFDLGQKYPKAFDFTYAAEDGSKQYPIVGCYGLGTTRLLGTIAEVFADDKGLAWPVEVGARSATTSQYASRQKGDDAAMTLADALLYATSRPAGVEALYDDRDARAGEKFADSDLIGIPVSRGDRTGRRRRRRY